MSIAYSLDANGLYQNLVEGLLNKGHEVTLVRSVNGIDSNRFENISQGFRVISVKTQNLFSTNLIKKGLAQVMLPFYFKAAIKEYLDKDEFDLILYATPPVTLAGVIEYCKNKYQAKTFLMLKDIFPQNAVDLGMMKKGSLIYKYFRYQEEKYYRISDYIGCMSQGNVDYVIKHNSNVNPAKLYIFPNSIKIDKEYSPHLNKETTTFMFGGNLGKPQNIPVLLEVLLALKDYDKVKFVIIGDGSEKKLIVDFMKTNNLRNFIYKDSLPQNEYEKVLDSADIGLISLDSRFTIPNIPSRFQTYLKLGKPVLAITDINTDLKEMIIEHDCGWWCDASNRDTIIKTIKKICEDKREQRIKGANGYLYLKESFDVLSNVKIIEDFIEGKEK